MQFGIVMAESLMLAIKLATKMRVACKWHLPSCIAHSCGTNTFSSILHETHCALGFGARFESLDGLNGYC